MKEKLARLIRKLPGIPEERHYQLAASVAAILEEEGLCVAQTFLEDCGFTYSTFIGYVRTPATTMDGQPVSGRWVGAHRDDLDQAGWCHCHKTAEELGLPPDHPTQLRPDGNGGFYNAPLFPIPQLRRLWDDGVE